MSLFLEIFYFDCTFIVCHGDFKINFIKRVEKCPIKKEKLVLNYAHIDGLDRRVCVLSDTGLEPYKWGLAAETMRESQLLLY